MTRIEIVDLKAGSHCPRCVKEDDKELTVWSYCAKCNGEKRHRVAARRAAEPSELPESCAFVRYEQSVLVCCGCDTYSFRADYMDDSFWNYETDGFEPQIEVYPRTDLGERRKLPIRALPPKIRLVYEESVSALNGQLPVLCAAGVRAVVDGVCAERGVVDGPALKEDGTPEPDGHGNPKRGRTLYHRIAGLAEKSVLTKEQADHLHALRILGNEAIHALEIPGESELNAALDLVEQVLRTVYETGERAGHLRKLYEERKAEGSGP